MNGPTIVPRDSVIPRYASQKRRGELICIAFEGGISIATIAKWARLKEATVAQIIWRAGAQRDSARLTSLLTKLPGARVNFSKQKSAAKRRGVSWEITLHDWCRVWDESGKWQQRGTGAAEYCMARKGDFGPYAPGNIYICTASENSSDGASARYGRIYPRVSLNGASDVVHCFSESGAVVDAASVFAGQRKVPETSLPAVCR